jgi:hypothetical protein
VIEEKFSIESYLRTAKDKYTYFLLAASASAIAFSISQTREDALAWSQLPLAIAVLCWAFSFYFGCRCASFYQKLLQDSADLYGSQNTMNNMPETKEQVLELLGDSYYVNLMATDNSK